MEAEIGVNSPDFLQKKIERLKTALDEANVLMDRQVTERDEARVQLEALRREHDELRRDHDEARRENDELRRQVEQGGGGAAPAEEPVAIDPVLERHLRGRIADLEAERDSLPTAARPTEDPALLGRVEALQSELDAARREPD